MGQLNICSQTTPDGSITSIVCSGSCTIENCTELQETMAAGLERSPRVELDLQQLEEIDLSAVQVFCSACKSAAASERTLIYVNALPEVLEPLAGRLGLTVGLPCVQNNNHPCIRFGGKN